MKVEITKSIDIADSAPSLPIVKVVKGETRDDLSDHVANRLIELGCAKEVDKEKDTEQVNSGVDTDESADNTGTSEDNTGDSTEGEGDGLSATPEATPETLKAELEGIALEQMDGPMGSEQKAKAALEAIGKERYGFDADKRKTVDGIIEAIVEAAFKKDDNGQG